MVRVYDKLSSQVIQRDLEDLGLENTPQYDPYEDETQNKQSFLGRQVTSKTTAGWKICYHWKDDSTSWEKLSNLKESHPVQTAEFAIIKGIDHEPAFNWWVKHVLKKRERIIAGVRNLQTRYLKRSHKYGIELPKTVEKALTLDAMNGNTL